MSHFVHVGMSAAEVGAMLRPLPIEIISADEDLAHVAGCLRVATAAAGLSLGDRFCLALAGRTGLPAMTADRLWRTIADLVDVEVILIR